MKKGYKYRIYPNIEQQDLLEKSFGCARFVYNKLLSSVTEQYSTHKQNPDLPKPDISPYGLTELIPSLKEKYSFLCEVSSVCLQQKAMDLSKSYKNFFKNKLGYPKYKSKRMKQSIRLVGQAFDIKDNNLHIARCKGPIKIKWSRNLPSKPSSVVVSKEPCGKYFASFICEYQPLPTNGDKILGLDLGIKSFYSDSDGVSIDAPKHYHRVENHLKRLQRSLSRKQKGSRNRNKARQKVAKLHAKAKQQRNDFLHKLSRSLVNDCKLISLETLNIKGMIKNRYLAKSISDLGWGTFLLYLRYKTIESQWCTLIQIDRWYPSTQTCSCCKHRLEGDSKLKLGQRLWCCPKCNTVHDRDTNAGINIRDEGYRLYEISCNQKSLNGVIIIDQIDVIA